MNWQQTLRYYHKPLLGVTLATVILLAILQWQAHTAGYVVFFATPVQATGKNSPIVRYEPRGGGAYALIGKPSLSVAFMNRVLAYYGSPASGLGQTFYNDGRAYGIDPAYALAFFQHESSFGTAGAARFTKSIGNSRCTRVEDYCFQNNVDGSYAGYNSWQSGINGWYWQIEQYINGGLTGTRLVTIDQIIPVYAPSGDQNNVAAYEAALKASINLWHSGAI